MSPGAQRVPVQVRQVRGLLQEQEGLRGSRGQQAHAQAAGGRRQGQVQEGDGGTQQGKFNLKLNLLCSSIHQGHVF